MPSILGCAFGLLLLLVLRGTSSAAPVASAAAKRIEGRVVDAAGRPIEGVVAMVEPAPRRRADAIRQVYRAGGGPDPVAGLFSEAGVASVPSDAGGRFEVILWGDAARRLDRHGCEFQLRLGSEGFVPMAHPLGRLVGSRFSRCPEPAPADSGSELPPVVLPAARSVTVRVVGPDGEPAPGAWVRSFRVPETPDAPDAPDAPKDDAGWHAASTTVRTDAQALATLPVGGGVDGGQWAVSAYRPGWAPARAPVERAVVELRLGDAAAQEVRVLGPDGPPMTDAGICFQPADWCLALTDIDGLATLSRPDGSVPVVIRAGSGSWPAELPARAAGDVLVEIDLASPRPVLDPEAGASLAGRVKSAEGIPIEDAEIYRLDGRHETTGNGRPSVDSDAMARSGVDGFFQIAAGPEVDSGEMSLEVWADDHLTRRLVELEPNVAAGGVMTGPEVEVVLRRATRLEGFVRSVAAEPLAGAELAVWDPDGGFTMAYPRTISGADGSFSLRRVDPADGGLVLFVSHAGHVTRRISWHDLPEPPGPAEIALEPALTLSGRVVGPEGVGVEEAAIGIARGPQPLDDALNVSATSGPDGRFELDGLPAGRWSVKVEHPEFERALHPVDLDSDREVDLPLEAAERYPVEGRVQGTEPRAGLRLALTVPDGPYRSQVPTATVDASGTFRFDDVRPGRYEIQLMDGPGVATAIVDPQDRDVEVAGPTKIEVRLVPGATITGRILGLEPERLRDVSVSGEGRASKVDPVTGVYRLQAVAPGVVRVRASVRGAPVQAEGEVTVEPGDDEVPLDLDFDAGLVLAGEVVREGEPVEGLLVRVQRAGSYGGFLTDATTDSAGRFAFRGLPAGEFRIDVHRRGFDGLLASRSVWIDGGLEEDLDDLVIEVESSIDVAGVVVDDESGEPVGGVRVVVTRDPQRHISTLVAAVPAVFTLRDGRFQFRDVASAIDSDSWYLVADREGFAKASRKLPADGADDLVIRLEPAHGLVLTVRSAEGETPSSVFAQVLDDAGSRLAFQFLEPGAGGRTALHDLPEGRWRLLLRGSVRSGEIVALVELDVPGPDLDVVGRPAAGVEMRIPALESSPGEAELDLRDALGRPFAGFPRHSEDGRASLEGLPAGPFTLHARSRDQVWSRQVHLVAGTTMEVVLE